MVPITTIPSKSSSFSDNLSGLEPHLKPDVALYIILRRHEDAPRFIAITYVPDSAKVRQKMLFASTRLTFVRELGTEHFRETIFVTTPEELSVKGFEKHDAHNKLAAPLTEEEQQLGEVKRAEQEAGQGTGHKAIHLSKNFAMPISDEAIAALKEVGEDGGRPVTMLVSSPSSILISCRKLTAYTQKINPSTEKVELVPEAPTPSGISELTKAISSTEPRFTFYRFTHTHDGAESSPVLFFYTCPSTPGNKSIKFRMMYPLMKRSVLDAAESQAGLTLEKKFEVEDPSEITEESVLEDLHPKTASRQGFSRPKRPGR